MLTTLCGPCMTLFRLPKRFMIYQRTCRPSLHTACGRPFLFGHKVVWALPTNQLFYAAAATASAGIDGPMQIITLQLAELTLAKVKAKKIYGGDRPVPGYPSCTSTI